MNDIRDLALVLHSRTWLGEPPPRCPRCEGHVRAILIAMRDPSDEMVSAAYAEMNPEIGGGFIDGWAAAIDKALEER